MTEPAPLVTDPVTGTLLMRRWRIRVLKGPDEGQSVLLEPGTALLGAAPAAALVLTDDSVSRYHAELDVLPEGARLRDLESTNGIFVGSEPRTESAFLGAGEPFRLGETVLLLETEDEPVTESRTPPIRHFGALVCADERMRRLFARLRQAAPTRSTIWLEGPVGSGRRSLAETLHGQGPGAGAFVMCSGTESADQLTAHIKRAKSGTLCLAEAEALNPDAQATLQSFIEERPIGRESTRLILISTRSLSAAGLTPKLIERLQGVHVRIPKLSSRLEDIRPLALLFAHRNPSGPISLGVRTLARLEKHDWPQEVAELKALITRLAATETSAENPIHKELRTVFLSELMTRHAGHVGRAGEALGLPSGAMFRMLRDFAIELDDL